MNAKVALSAVAAALLAGCAGTPTWDTTVFPEQPVYNASPLAGTAVDASVVNHLIESPGN
jgi:type IV pilus biogenesis protein CpaD/CtpE